MPTRSKSAATFPDRPRPLAPRQAESHVLGDGEMREKREVLEHQADTSGLGRHGRPRRGDQPPADQDAALLDAIQTGDEPKGRGLAAAGGSHKAVDLAWPHGEAHAREDTVVTIAMSQALDLEAELPRSASGYRHHDVTGPGDRTPSMVVAASPPPRS